MSIILEKVSKRFDGAAVIDEVSLEIADGELFVLLGASGSGKSTILRLIAGLTPLDSGRILMHGKRVDELPAQKRGVGFVFQNYSLFRHMTVAENIEFGLKIRGVPRKERAKRCEDLLGVVGLAGLEDRFSNQLSGGQMQRVALARALAYEPAVLLLDEPFGALDVKIRGQLRQSLRAIQRELGVTTILVTHDQEEAFELGDRIGVMEGGHLLEVGRPIDLYRRPRNEYVATFVGSGNVIAGRMEGGRIRLGQVQLEPPPDLGDLAPGASVSVLCRPEEIDLSRDATTLTGTLLGRGQVVDRMFAGASERLFLRIPELRGAHPIFPAPAFGEEGTVLQALVRPEGPGEALPAVGEEFYVAVRSFHVFAHRGMRVLVCSDGSPRSELAISFGIVTARALDGPVVLLGVAPTPGDEPRLSAWLEDVARPSRESAAPEITVRTRVGDPAEEIQAELEEHPYELVILGSAAGPSLGATASRVARSLLVPVLIVPSPRPALRRILICTAVGEPGKADIEFGGRIARRAGASVTILHVRPESARRVDLAAAEEAAIAHDPQPAAAHLEKGLKTLGRLTVTGQVKIRYGAVVSEIFAEADSGDYDLIVIGAHAGGGPRGRSPRAGEPRHDVAHEVVTRARIPVLMVPLRAL